MPTQANFVTGLPFGKGKVGERNALETPEEFDDFARSLAEHTVPLTKTNTADCVDERKTIALGDGTKDPEILANRVVVQMPGGLCLAVTKAAVAADLAILRDKKNFKDAYLKMYDILTALNFEDGGHEDCGASKLVEASTAEEVETAGLLAALPVLTVVNEQTSGLLQQNQFTKKRRLEEDYYANWSQSWHESFLAEHVPHNFSILAVDHEDPQHGHGSSGIYAIKSSGMGFAKNRFIQNTQKEAFVDSIAAAEELTNRIIPAIGGSALERERLRLEFGVDPAQVLNQLVIEGHPVFAEAA